MALLVDCYNLLHTAMPPDLAGLDEDRLSRLMLVSQWARGRVTIVCDGNPKPHSPDPSAVSPIRLIYSGQNRTADDVIIGLIDSDTVPRRLTVVSNDRQIQRSARRRRCKILPCERCIHILSRLTPGNRPAPKGEEIPRQKYGPLNRSQTRRWLEWFGFDPENEMDPDTRPWWDDIDMDEI